MTRTPHDPDARRRFLRGGAMAAGTLATLQAPAVLAQPKVRWRMATTWSPSLDVLFGAAQRMAKLVEEMSGGRFSVEVFAAGQLMPALACFDACSKGTIEAFMGSAYYWADREPAVQWFSAVPFGMNANGMSSWFHRGDGLKLWEETYAPFGLVPRPGPSTGAQMFGWFRKRIATMQDFKGLRMRIPGLGGQVIARAGGTVVLIPPAEIYAALERGAIDTAEFVGPHDDMKLGLQNTARYYYYPGWHETGGMSEFVFNRKAYDALPADLRQILDAAAATVAVQGLADYEIRNAQALDRLRTEYKGRVDVVALPTTVLQGLAKLSAEVVRAESEKSPAARKVYASFQRFQAQIGGWRAVSEGAYHQLIAT